MKDSDYESDYDDQEEVQGGNPVRAIESFDITWAEENINYTTQ